MHITIEQNKVIVNLDENEFPAFEAMFANLKLDKFVVCDFREFDFGSYETARKLLPLHLCRTIGEANLRDDPFATMSLYPFWKHGFAFGKEDELIITPQMEDPHKKAVAADEFGMGFCCWAMEELFGCDTWADCSALIKAGAVFPTGSRRPDFVCTFPDGSLGIFEAKGTTGTAGSLALSEGKLQTQGITAPDPISLRVVVGCALGGDATKIVLLDPPPDPADGAKPTNLTADLVREAAKGMRASIRGEAPTQPPETDRSLSRPEGRIETTVTETIFRGPDGEIALLHDDYKPDKLHGWLEVK